MIRKITAIMISCIMIGVFLYSFYQNDEITSARARPVTCDIVFDNILLIINYNHPYYQSREFLENIYKKAFPHIVFYGEKEGENIYTQETHEGWFAHRVLADAMHRFPNYDGYLMVQDDCLVNYWNLPRFDCNKIWLNEATQRSTLMPCPSWVWWERECGLKAVKNSLSLVDHTYIKQLQNNCGSDTAVTGAADFIYIPACFKEEFLKLNLLFNEAFIEIALPTIAFCLDKKENIEFTHFIWDFNSKKNQLDTTLDWIHPLKFSSLTNQDLVKKYLKEQ